MHRFPPGFIRLLVGLRGRPCPSRLPVLLARWLRSRADRLDGGRSYVVYLTAKPAVTNKELDAAMAAAMPQVKAVLADLVRLRAWDAQLEALNPALFAASVRDGRER
ncbi:MAG: hypothetical protein WBG92_06270 [Thiohalocapsa sp.]